MRTKTLNYLRRRKHQIHNCQPGQLNVNVKPTTNKHRNLLKVDPTRTGLMRRRAVARVRRQFAELRAALWNLVVRQDVFGLVRVVNTNPNHDELGRFTSKRYSPEMYKIAKEWADKVKKPTTNSLDLPDIRHGDDYRCGTAAAMSVGHHFGVGPATLKGWQAALHTDRKDGTHPEDITAFLRQCGLQVEARAGLTVDDLADYTSRGWPVLCPIQSGGVGHWVVVTDANSEMNSVAYQDPAKGPVKQRGGEWLANWYDRSADRKYVWYGIAVGPQVVVNENPNHDEKGRFTSGGESLSADEKSAVLHYSEGGYFGVNGRLRGEKGFSPSEAVNRQIDLIDSAISKSTVDKETTVYRGIFNKSLKSIKEGGIISDKAYMSTSLSKKFVEEFGKKNMTSLKIVIPKGYPGLNVDPLVSADRAKVAKADGAGPGAEQEILLPRNTSLKVTKVTHRTVGSRTVIDVEATVASSHITNSLLVGIELDNRFCATGEGGGVDPSCGAAAKLGDKAVGAVKKSFAKFTERYGKAGAIAMMAAMAATMPLPGNIFAVIGIAEGVRAAVKMVRNEDWDVDAMVQDVLDLADHLHLGGDADLLRPKVETALHRQMVTNARDFGFHSDPEKLEAFKKWLRDHIKGKITAKVEERLWEQYAEQAWKKGAGRAFDDVNGARKTLTRDKSEMDFYQGGREQFLRDAFNQPVSVDRIKVLASRSFDDLKNVTDDMTVRLSRTLTDGLARGDNPREVAKDLAEDLDISQARAEAIARTEIIRAHSEGTLDAMTRMGVTKVGVQVEYATAGDDRVCELCAGIEGSIFSVEEAHGIIPQHPNCRCMWLAAMEDWDE